MPVTVPTTSTACRSPAKERRSAASSAWGDPASAAAHATAATSSTVRTQASNAPRGPASPNVRASTTPRPAPLGAYATVATRTVSSLRFWNSQAAVRADGGGALSTSAAIAASGASGSAAGRIATDPTATSCTEPSDVATVSRSTSTDRWPASRNATQSSPSRASNQATLSADSATTPTPRTRERSDPGAGRNGTGSASWTEATVGTTPGACWAATTGRT